MVPDRVLVTGGAGFIGSHVVDRLVARGADVHVMDDFSTGSRSNLPPSVGIDRIDLADPDAAERIAVLRPDRVVRCAAQTSVPKSVDHPVQDARANVLGSLNVIRGATLAGSSRLVYVTTGGALYGGPMVRPWVEDDPVEPQSPYGLSKWVVERYLAVVAAGLPWVILRLSNGYGPRQQAGGEAGVIASFIDRMRRGEPVVVDRDGEQRRDFLYVADAIDAVERALARPDAIGRTMNISTGRGTSINDLLATLSLLTGYMGTARHGALRRGDIRESSLDPHLAGRLLDWAPSTDLEAGLRLTLQSDGPDARR